MGLGQEKIAIARVLQLRGSVLKANETPMIRQQLGFQIEPNNASLQRITSPTGFSPILVKFLTSSNTHTTSICQL